MNDLNKILKNKLENFQPAPPESMLNNVRNQYPKKSFVDFVSQNKYYFILGLSAIIITGFFLINDSITKKEIPVQDKINATDNIIVNNNDYTDHTTIEDITNSTENENIEIPIEDNFKNINNEIRTTEPKIKYVNKFSFNDTSVCGNSIDIIISDEIENYSFPGLVADFKSERITITTQKKGSYYIYFNNDQGTIILKDSALVIFNQATNPNVRLSDKNICYGENIILNFSDKNNIKPKTFNVDASQINNNSFEISNLHPGENNILVLFKDVNNCSFTFSENVLMSEKPEYTITSRPSFCSQQNGIVSIESDNLQNPVYSLNEDFISKTGKFDNLNPGIYYLKVEYANECLIYDTLLLRDSLNISPYFILDKDLLDSKKYLVRNMTKLDNHGYEQNNDITFEWKINGESYETKDNPEIVFDTQGKYTIELIAKINENCESVYSETIHVSGTCFRIPNIFTPNGDGTGDFFKIVSDNEILNYNIQIINKLGEVVYESNDIEESWNGKINGNNDACEGLYYYIIRGEDMLNNKIEQKGALQLVRN